MERLGLITVDMEYATAEITGDKEFFYGDNNSIEITIENATEEIGDVCYFCANQIGQLYVGNTTLVDGKYVIDKENMDYILNVCGEVIIQIQIFNTDNKRITCSNNITIQSLLNFDRKKYEVLTPNLQVSLAELLDLAEKIASGEINIMGPQGPVGPQGIAGEAGQNGKDGTSIFSVTKKAEDSNIIVITLTDATTQEIEIPTVAGVDGKDGKDGAQGPAGNDGKDYVLTDTDKEEIAEIATASLSSEIGDIGAILDEINGEVI